MRKVDTRYGYDFYIGTYVDKTGDRYTLYNIVKENDPAPSGGYFNRQYIENIKGVKFADRYQPTLHGTNETYLNYPL